MEQKNIWMELERMELQNGIENHLVFVKQVK